MSESEIKNSPLNAATLPKNPIPLPMTDSEFETYKLHRRFDRLGRLVGDSGVERLMASHVMVIGLGGVGSWAAEALVRSGIGELSIIDFDEVCVTNTNRQLHAMSGVMGANKVEVLAERFKKINPALKINVHVKFYDAKTSDELFARRPDYVIDAIDNITAKCHLINRCWVEKIPLICATGSGGKLDPTQIEVKDLAETKMDPLCRSLRRILREKYAFPEKGLYGIQAVFSREPVIQPKELHYDGGKGFRCVCPSKANSPHGCEQRNVILGTAGFVTSTFGMICASLVVRAILAETK